AEDGIRDFHVTGVQTCALPISGEVAPGMDAADVEDPVADRDAAAERLVRARSPEDAEGEVLDGEVAALGLGGGHPAAGGRIVRLVESDHPRLLAPTAAPVAGLPRGKPVAWRLRASAGSSSAIPARPDGSPSGAWARTSRMRSAGSAAASRT